MSRCHPRCHLLCSKVVITRGSTDVTIITVTRGFTVNVIAGSVTNVAIDDPSLSSGVNNIVLSSRMYSNSITTQHDWITKQVV
eukprot:m.175636 g.175636  ORF g.175636 m.175636 type:complete len:83 (-) comp31828_c0_seq7:259-507(-)